MADKSFCIFILSHGRPDNVKTYTSLMSAKCKYPIYIIIDNEDDTAFKYIENFGKDNVIIFDKMAWSKKTDTADNSGNRKCIIFARNASFSIAEKLGYEYFLQLDDDYESFGYTYDFNDNFSMNKIKNIDRIFDIFLEYLRSSGSRTIAFIQGGDMIGGGENTYLKGGHYPFIKRKAMNSFFCSIDRRINFIGRINEDVNTYISQGKIGKLFMTIPLIRLNQTQTQANRGGMTDIYSEQGTYIKSFYSVMINPSSVSIKILNSKYGRLHHSIVWNNTIPKILRADK